MSPVPFDFVNLFVRSPGDLLYFLIIIAVSLSGVFMALGQRVRHPGQRAAERYLLASSGVVVAWVMLLLGALYTLLTRQNAAAILPPLERAASVVTILLLGWAFLTADHERWGRVPNFLVLILLVIVVVGYAITGFNWPLIAATRDFNLSAFGITWTFVPAVLATLGLVLAIIYFRLVVDAPLKLLFFLLLAVGFGITLFQVTQGMIIGNYAGLARLTFMAALAVLPAVIYRAIIAELEQKVSEAKKAAEKAPPAATIAPAVARPRPPEATPVERESALLMRALGQILDNATPENIPRRIVDAALDIIKADVGALLRLHDANYADITAAYDRIIKREITGLALSLDQQPTLVNAIERQTQRPLYPDRNVQELDDLFSRLDINQRGPVYFQPLIHDKHIVAMLMVGLPYSGRELREVEQELLKGLGVISASLLSLSYTANDAQRRAEERVIQAMVAGVSPDEVNDADVVAARKEIDSALSQARDQIAELTRQVMELKVALDYERSRVSDELEESQEGASISQQMLALTEEQSKLREERDRLAARLQEAEAALAGATSTDNQALINSMTETLRREKDDLVAQRAHLQAELDDLRAKDKMLLPNMQQVVQRMMQERNRLENQRNELQARLDDIENQLKTLGIEGGSGSLGQLLAQFAEQRNGLQTKNDSLKRERDMLLAERARLEESILQARERDTRIETLQNEIKNLASDREALIKQRDQLRSERDELASDRERSKEQRQRMVSQAAGYEVELSASHAEQAQLRMQLQRLADERSGMIAERDRLLAQKQALESERDQLLARLEGDRERLQQLGSDGIGSFRKMVEDLTSQRDQLERELNEARRQLALVENQLERMELANKAQPKYQMEQPELVLGMAQELRTPMTSVIGYMHLLLNESAGILGEMQRKYLQRILSNFSRLATMVEDLVRIAALDAGKFTLSPQSVNVVAVIESAITEATTQFREKGLSVHLDLDDQLPALQLDRTAVSQIVGQLLTNAYLVSPADSDLYISAHKQVVELKPGVATDCLVVAVEDRGGGIAPEDAERVFARRYRAENPLIQGLGDTGVGLSLAKALAEAHGGKLWVESQPGLGSIFAAALPFEPALEPEG
ncbi:MAG: hypothetical protein HXY40_06145 [Chloroflexi bacterium]|nr:hypothetical protein [Chloroflexota bacterium]